MENHFFDGKIHYKWPFSIAMLVYQRVTTQPISALQSKSLLRQNDWGVRCQLPMASNAILRICWMQLALLPYLIVSTFYSVVVLHPM